MTNTFLKKMYNTCLFKQERTAMQITVLPIFFLSQLLREVVSFLCERLTKEKKNVLEYLAGHFAPIPSIRQLRDSRHSLEFQLQTLQEVVFGEVIWTTLEEFIAGELYKKLDFWLRTGHAFTLTYYECKFLIFFLQNDIYISIFLHGVKRQMIRSKPKKISDIDLDLLSEEILSNQIRLSLLLVFLEGMKEQEAPEAREFSVPMEY
jgi:hypothetical protein